MTQWYEDIRTGETVPLGSHTFELDEIIEFCTAYDPQYFHTDPELAKHSHFGGIIASGWHTACVGQRHMVERLFLEEDIQRDKGRSPGVSGPSPGINKIVFNTPVRPGDTVHYTMCVDSKRKSNSLPGWGLLFLNVQGTNQRGDLIYRADIVGLSKLRDFKPTPMQKLGQWAMSLPLLRRLMKK